MTPNCSARAVEAEPFLPYGRQVIEADDIAAVAAVLEGDYLTTGPAVAKFEQALAGAVGSPCATVCSNGTAALYLAARALKLGPGSKVVVPSITFLATASAPHMSGAEIVFADVDPDSGLMRPKDLADAIARVGGADAVFNVHLNGQCGAVEEIAEIARDHGMKIVDDACHALGTCYRTSDGSLKQAGDNAFSDLTVFSFHPVKAIAMGEGGAVTTTDAGLDAALKRERNHGMTREPEDFTAPDAFEASGHANPWYYELVEPGFNWRANDIQCALGLSQLGKLERFAARRRALAAAYDALLAPLAPHLKPVAKTWACRPNLHLYPVLIDFEACGLGRAELMARLAAEHIGSQVHYFPVHRQRYYARRYGPLTLPGAERYYARVLSLPFFAAMTIRDVERVVAALTRLLGL